MKNKRKDRDRGNISRENSWKVSETIERYLFMDYGSSIPNSLPKKKSVPKYIIIKLQRTKDTEKNLKSSWRKKKKKTDYI